MIDVIYNTTQGGLVMFSKRIQYGYKYESDFGVFLVRRLDGESLCYDIPITLFNTMMMEYEIKTGNRVPEGYEFVCVHYDSVCKNAIVDFRRFNYTQTKVDEIVRQIEEQYRVPNKSEKRKVLSRIFNRK